MSSALVFGTGIHTAVEQHFQALLSGDPKPDLDALLFAYRSAWLPHDPDAIQFGSKETRESLDDLAARMLTAFLSEPCGERSGAGAGRRRRDSRHAGRGRAGFVREGRSAHGRRRHAGGDRHQDFSRGKWSQEQVEDSGEQLLLYSHLASEISPGKKIATRFLVLTKTKEPVIEEHVREVEPAAVKRTLAGVERVWRAIESGVFYPAPSVMACSGCGYRAACRAWMG